MKTIIWRRAKFLDRLLYRLVPAYRKAQEEAVHKAIMSFTSDPSSPLCRFYPYRKTLVQKERNNYYE